jgi:hypothetical protein
MKTVIKHNYLTGVLLFAVIGLSAQEILNPSELKQKTVVTEPQTMYKGFFRAGVGFNYGVLDKYFTADGKKESFPSNAWASSLSYQCFLMYGISNRFQVELSIPYRTSVVSQSVAYEVPELGIVGVTKWKRKSNGLGDLNIIAGYQIITEKESRPSFTGYLSAVIPTGKKNPTNIKSDNEYDEAVGSGEPSVNLELRVRKVKYPFSYSIAASYELFFGGNKIIDVSDPVEKPFRSGSQIDFGGYLHFHINNWISIRNSADFFYFFPNEYDGVKEEDSSWTIMYHPGINFQIKQFRLAQAVVLPTFGKLTAADPGYILVVQYTF